MDSIGRRVFLTSAAGFLLLGTTVKLMGCSQLEPGEGAGGDDEPQPPRHSDQGRGAPSAEATPTAEPAPDPQVPEDEVGVITNNHGHSAVVTGVQLQAGAEVVLNIKAAANHVHNLTLTSEQLASILAGELVTVESDGQDTVFHTHQVTFNS